MEATIKIHGQIGYDPYEFMPDPNSGQVVTYADVFAQVKAAKDAGATSYSFHINSQGGYVEEALTIARLIETLPNTTAVAKFVASAANVIYAACKTKQVSEDSKFMLHTAWVSDVYGNANELQRVAESLKETDARMFSYIAERLGIEKAELEQFVNAQDTWFGYETAKKIGYTNERKDELTLAKALYMNKFIKRLAFIAKTGNHKALTLQLKDGAEIFVDSEEGGEMVGAETNAPDGTHELADGSKITVSGGVITEMTPAEGEPATTSPAGMTDEKDKQIEEMAAKIAELESKLQEQSAEASQIQEAADKAISALGDEMAKLKAQIKSEAKPPRRGEVKTSEQLKEDAEAQIIASLRTRK